MTGALPQSLADGYRFSGNQLESCYALVNKECDSNRGDNEFRKIQMGQQNDTAQGKT